MVLKQRGVARWGRWYVSAAAISSLEIVKSAYLGLGV
jgi:hypothetical protein